ncbi:hypothetical protein [Streptomyces sp. G3]|uniref:hypothetical protein n=1 Tax=Streptomyces sp. G3 TaxID=690144 RepID=UPI0027E4E351|nr:hypothetical protein [Streptomyces sp. G3]
MTSAKPVIVYPPSDTGGRRVRIDGEILGTAFSLHDLTVFLQHARLEGRDDLDLDRNLAGRVAGRRPRLLGTLTRHQDLAGAQIEKLLPSA